MSSTYRIYKGEICRVVGGNSNGEVYLQHENDAPIRVRRMDAPLAPDLPAYHAMFVSLSAENTALKANQEGYERSARVRDVRNAELSEKNMNLIVGIHQLNKANELLIRETKDLQRQLRIEQRIHEKQGEWKVRPNEYLEYISILRIQAESEINGEKGGNDDDNIRGIG